jgi:uncharacterized protein YhbP (UPF0306 family)
MNELRFTAIRTQDAAGRTVEASAPSEELLRESVLRVLEDNVLCSIATVTPEGRAHINTAYFSYSSGLSLYFLSHPDSLHCRNLSSNPTMAMTVFSSAQQWEGHDDRGVQLFGSCEQAMGSSADEAERSYGRRFPAYTGWKAALSDDDLAREYRLYRFAVTTVKILDEKNLGDAAFVRASVADR